MVPQASGFLLRKVCPSPDGRSRANRDVPALQRGWDGGIITLTRGEVCRVELTPIAYMRSEFPQKFGVPRQSGLVPQLSGQVVFAPEFRAPEALRGLDGFSHLWLIWGFHKARREGWSPTVRPPRLGGNARMGVFATRSPYRPNPLGLSCVELDRVEPATAEGPVLHVRGADLVDGTPIYDIKPYLPYADCRPEAAQGFAPAPEAPLRVEAPPQLLEKVPAHRRQALLAVLAQDPRPRYQQEPDRRYGLSFAGLEVHFTVADGVLTLLDVEQEHAGPE